MHSFYVNCTWHRGLSHSPAEQWSNEAAEWESEFEKKRNDAIKEKKEAELKAEAE